MCGRTTIQKDGFSIQFCEFLASHKLMESAAIMIIDTERLMQSSPQPQFYEIQNNVSIPTFLVRKEDGHHFLPELEPESNLKFVTSVKIYGSYNAIPNPEWICDVKDYDDCVPLEFSLEGYLAGT